MPKWTETKIAERIRKGRGRGKRLDYQSWYKKTELKNSESNLNQIKGHLIRRPYVLCDDLDCLALRILEEIPGVVDIWENYRLDREVTLAISEQLGVQHPCYDGTDIPKVLTIKFIVVTQNEGQDLPALKGIDVFRTSNLTKKRLLCQDIINCYIQHELNTPKLITFTEREISAEILKGFNWITNSYEISAVSFPGINIKKIQQQLISEVSAQNNSPINITCNDLDKKLKYPDGSSLRICRSMLAHGILLVDSLEKPIGEATPVCQLRVNSDSELLS